MIRRAVTTPCKPEFSDHEWTSLVSVDREYEDGRVFDVVEYECAQCEETFTELELAEERSYDWSDLD
ncbi:MAG: hypothetical protein ACRD5J_10715 [Nitrososphaeraceae archaeon]